MRIALLADTHLSDITGTPQEESFLWAIEELKQLAPDACVWLGDITAGGSADAAMRFRATLDTLPFPSVTVPGNSDIRSPEAAPIMERVLLNYPEGLQCGDVRIVGVNTSHNLIDENERKRLLRLNVAEDILLCSHQAASFLDEDSRAFLRAWLASVERQGHRVLAWAHGHSHVYREGEFEGVPTFSLCALDIDKNNGRDAHFCLFSFDASRNPIIEEIPYRRYALDAWSEAEKEELRNALGITCYHTEEDMAFATAHGVRHIEWQSVRPDGLSLLSHWRETGGKTFSLCFPALGWEEDAMTETEEYKRFADFAISAGADTVTVRPPMIPNTVMLKTNVFDLAADAVADILRPLVTADIDILIENNHTCGSTPADPLLRHYGCSPLEVTSWRDALNERLERGACHLRLDVASARRNEPLNEPYPIGKWYSLLGADTHGYHLHQVEYDEKTKTVLNHSPISGLHSGFISFDGFLWAWHTGLLTHAPIILEICHFESAKETWMRLQDLLK